MRQIEEAYAKILKQIHAQYTVGYVSTNTIKTHLGHIYRKLGAQNRDAAVERARELGLIPVGDSAPVM